MMEKGKLDTIHDKAADRLIELLDKKTPTPEEISAIQTLYQIVYTINYQLRMRAGRSSRS